MFQNYKSIIVFDFAVQSYYTFTIAKVPKTLHHCH